MGQNQSQQQEWIAHSSFQDYPGAHKLLINKKESKQRNDKFKLVRSQEQHMQSNFDTLPFSISTALSK